MSKSKGRKPYTPTSRPALDETLRQAWLAEVRTGGGELVFEAASLIVTFYFPLAYPLGVGDGVAATFTRASDQLPDDLKALNLGALVPEWVGPIGSSNFVNIRFMQLESDVVDLNPGLELSRRAAGLTEASSLSESSSLEPITSTVAGVTTIVDGSRLVADGSGALSDAFEMCLGYLANLQRALVVSTHVRMAPITRQMLPVVVSGSLRKAASPEADLEPFAFFLGTSARQSMPAQPIAKDEFALALGSLFPEAGPISYAFFQLRNEAHIAMEDRGDTLTSLILIASAAEVFLDSVLLAMMCEEALDVQVARAVFDQKALLRRVGGEFHLRLGGNWSSGPVGHWRKHVAYARNTAVHSGMVPSEAAARTALDSVPDLVDFVRVLLTSPKVYKRYPQTAWYFFGVYISDGQRPAWNGPKDATGEFHSFNTDLADYADAVLSRKGLDA